MSSSILVPRPSVPAGGGAYTTTRPLSAFAKIGARGGLPGGMAPGGRCATTMGVSMGSAQLRLNCTGHYNGGLYRLTHLSSSRSGVERNLHEHRWATRMRGDIRLGATLHAPLTQIQPWLPWECRLEHCELSIIYSYCTGRPRTHPACKVRRQAAPSLVGRQGM